MLSRWPNTFPRGHRSISAIILSSALSVRFSRTDYNGCVSSWHMSLPASSIHLHPIRMKPFMAYRMTFHDLTAMITFSFILRSNISSWYARGRMALRELVSTRLWSSGAIFFGGSELDGTVFNVKKWVFSSWKRSVQLRFYACLYQSDSLQDASPSGQLGRVCAALKNKGPQGLGKQAQAPQK
jgi:hypothetical protein